MPGWETAAVVGAESAEWGQTPVLILETGGTESTGSIDAEARLANMQAAVRGELGAAAVPRRVFEVDHLPRLPSGKPDLAALTELVREQGAHPDAGDSSDANETTTEGDTTGE